MPIPKPTADESQSDYMGRCMHFLTHESGTDRPQDQMVAICMQLWRDRNKVAAQHPTDRKSLPFTVKALDAREFEGYGSVFSNVDLGGDVVLPGAFSKSLKAHTEAGTLPQMFWMHQPDKIPGKWLTMEEDDHGLYVRGTLAPTPLGEEMRTLLKMEAVRGLSIGYMIEDDSYDKEGNRLLKQIDLWETSLVSMAMNPLASVTQAKSRLSAAGEYVPTARELEAYFRKLNCSKRVARSLIARLFADDSSGETLEDVERKLFGQDLSGGTPDGSRWDAANSELERALEAVRDSIIADSIKVPNF